MHVLLCMIPITPLFPYHHTVNNIFFPLSFSTPVELSLILLPTLISIASLHSRPLLSWYLRLRLSRFPRLSLSLSSGWIDKRFVHLFIANFDIDLFGFASSLTRQSRVFGLGLNLNIIVVGGEGTEIARQVIVVHSFARRKICESSLLSSVRTV